ncbi:MAG TPA: Mur ligase domain-containing protein, partial [Candidatus Woesebacteria bacterium]|nr:Mur ligase domain-containing protein [Candidatus Woesebacteria bacterium]
MNKSATASEISTLLNEAKQFYLVGIKGVGMTSLAQCLTDMGKKVTGADVADEFVTQSILDSMQLGIEVGFTQQLPEDTQVVIYSGAHSGKANPLVKQAQARNLPVFSHAEVLGWMFNQKQGLAVCGVGG